MGTHYNSRSRRVIQRIASRCCCSGAVLLPAPNTERGSLPCAFTRIIDEVNANALRLQQVRRSKSLVCCGCVCGSCQRSVCVCVFDLGGIEWEPQPY